MSWQTLQDVFASLSAASFELNSAEHALEPLARHKSWDQGRDLVAVYLGGVFHSFGAEPQPEIAEITEFNHVTIGEFPRDNGQQRFDGSHHVRRGESGHVAGSFGQVMHTHSAGGLDGWVILLWRTAVSGFTSLDDIEFDAHERLLSKKWFAGEQYRSPCKEILQGSSQDPAFRFEGSVYIYAKIGM